MCRLCFIQVHGLAVAQRMDAMSMKCDNISNFQSGNNSDYFHEFYAEYALFIAYRCLTSFDNRLFEQ